MFENAANYLQKGIFPASRVGRIIGAGLLVVLVLLTVSDVVLRHFFNAPIPGTLELIELGLGVIVFLSLAFCAFQKGHVVVDVVVMQFSKRAQVIITAIMYLCSAGMIGVISWQLFLHAMRMLDMSRVTAILRISVYPYAFIAFIGSALLALVFFIHFLFTLAEARRQ